MSPTSVDLHREADGRKQWLHGFEAQAGAIHVRILRPLLRCELGEPVNEFMPCPALACGGPNEGLCAQD